MIYWLALYFQDLFYTLIFLYTGLPLRHVKLTFQNDQDLKSPYHHRLDHQMGISTADTFQVVNLQISPLMI